MKRHNEIMTSPAALPAAREFVLEATDGSAADCIRFDIGMARHHGSLSVAYLARAGWRLAHEKASLAYGAWDSWCTDRCGITRVTADRYIAFYHATVGKWREAQGLANSMVEELTDKMIAAATAGLEYKTGTKAMEDLGIIRRPKGWGGERAGAGRKSKTVEEELDEVANSEAGMFSAAWGAIEELLRLSQERDLFRRLSAAHFAQVSGALGDLAKASAAELERRIGN